MNIESARRFCLSLPFVTEEIKWDEDLTFSVGRKMFAVIAMNPGVDQRISFKCTAEKYSELIECPNILPAPYLARFNWVSLLRFDALEEREIKALIRRSHRLVFSRLPKKVQLELQG